MQSFSPALERKVLSTNRRVDQDPVDRRMHAIPQRALWPDCGKAASLAQLRQGVRGARVRAFGVRPAPLGERSVAEG